MPQLADPSTIRSRPASITLGELAIAAGLVGESVTIACDFLANTLCQVWKYYTHSLGPGNVIHVRARRDFKNFAQRIASIRAVFIYSPRRYQDVAWSIQMAGPEAMSPRPAVFCGFQHEDPESDPGLKSPIANDEREVAAVHKQSPARELVLGSERRRWVSFRRRCPPGNPDKHYPVKAPRA